MLMVKAGPPVDAVIASVLPYLEKGDIIIDGGNSEYIDTNASCVLNYSGAPCTGSRKMKTSKKCYAWHCSVHNYFIRSQHGNFFCSNTS